MYLDIWNLYKITIEVFSPRVMLKWVGGCLLFDGDAPFPQGTFIGL